MKQRDIAVDIVKFFAVFWLYRFCPWIAHAKTVSQISPSNGTLFKIKV